MLVFLAGCAGSSVSVQVRHNTEDVQTYIVGYQINIPPVGR